MQVFEWVLTAIAIVGYLGCGILMLRFPKGNPRAGALAMVMHDAPVSGYILLVTYLLFWPVGDYVVQPLAFLLDFYCDRIQPHLPKRPRHYYQIQLHVKDLTTGTYHYLIYDGATRFFSREREGLAGGAYNAMSKREVKKRVNVIKQSLKPDTPQHIVDYLHIQPSPLHAARPLTYELKVVRVPRGRGKVSVHQY